MPGRGRLSAEVNERSTVKPSVGKIAVESRCRNSMVSGISSAGWPNHTRKGSQDHSSSAAAMLNPAETISPSCTAWRTLARSRPSRPIACAAMGATAMASPLPTSQKKEKMPKVSAPTARAWLESRASSSTSVVWMAICASCVPTIGSASVSVARASRRIML